MDVKTINLTCVFCGNTFDRNLYDYRRRIKNGYTQFFCSSRCAAVFGNSEVKSKIIEVPCKYCGTPFQTKEKKGKKCCSRTCASKYSATFNIITPKFKEKMSKISKEVWCRTEYHENF
jgi:protein-arginine kinase activator protein McsA